MGGGFGGPRAAENPQIKVAKLEMEGVTDMFNKMGELCFQKCLGRYNEPDLNVGEMSCTDRCVSKYMEAHRKIGEKFQEFQQMEQARMQAQGMAMPGQQQ